MKKVVLVDLDGTIARVSPSRLALLKEGRPTDLSAFYADDFNDQPIEETVELVKHLHRKYRIVYCTSRSERVRTKTLNWLEKHDLPHNPTRLLMRPDDDERHTVEVKPDLVKRYGIRLNEIAFVLEDDPAMVSKWKELSVKCLQVVDL